LALLLPQEKRAQWGAFAAEMLVRALKMLGYFSIETTRTTIATAALDQPGDEVGAYGRTVMAWQR
jgi:Tfp pilus assembly protein PilW